MFFEQSLIYQDAMPAGTSPDEAGDNPRAPESSEETGGEEAISPNTPEAVENETSDALNGLNIDIQGMLSQVMDVLSNLAETLKEALNGFLTSMGYDVEAGEESENLNVSMNIISRDGKFYILNVESNEEVEIDGAYDSDNDGTLSPEETQAYLEELQSGANANETTRGQAALIIAAQRAHLDETAETLTSNEDYENPADQPGVSARNENSPEDIGERTSGIYNLRARATLANGAKTYTSGYPGVGDNQNRRAHVEYRAVRENLRREYAGTISNESIEDIVDGLSDEAFDTYYAYKMKGINKIFSLSHERYTIDGINELVSKGLIRRGEIEQDDANLNTSAEHLGGRNVRAILKAYRLYKTCGPNDGFLSHCTHGRHRGPFILLACYMLHNNCSRYQAEIDNGVAHNFLEGESYEAFNNLLNEVEEQRESLRSQV